MPVMRHMTGREAMRVIVLKCRASAGECAFAQKAKLHHTSWPGRGIRLGYEYMNETYLHHTHNMCLSDCECSLWSQSPALQVGAAAVSLSKPDGQVNLLMCLHRLQVIHGQAIASSCLPGVDKCSGLST